MLRSRHSYEEIISAMNSKIEKKKRGGEWGTLLNPPELPSLLQSPQVQKLSI